MEDLNNLNNDLKFVIDLCRIVILIYCLEKIFKVWIKNFFVVKKKNNIYMMGSIGSIDFMWGYSWMNL